MTDIQLTYEQARLLVDDGDVVFFSHHNKIGDYIIKGWQWVTHKKSDPNEGVKFSHVGSVLTLGKRVFLLESSFSGGVRMVLLSSRQPDLIVKMGLDWNQEAEDFAMQNLGRKYGLFESIGAGMGLRASILNNKFICTEFVAGICDKLRYNFPKTKQLPNNFYSQLRKEPKKFIWVTKPIDLI